MTARAEQPEPGKIPLRSCVGCKVRAAKSSLLRIGVGGDGIVPDPQARQPGRGAYLHPSLECFELAQRRRAFTPCWCDCTAILVRCPASRAILTISTAPLAISGTSSAKSLRTKSGWVRESVTDGPRWPLRTRHT